MSGFSIQKFKGSIPRVSPRLLKPEYAKTAVDCYLDTEDLSPVTNSLLTGYTFSEEPGRIYPYYDSDAGDFLNWFWFPYWTNAYFNVVPNDKYNRIYYLDDTGKPMITDFDNIDLDAVDGLGNHIPSITTGWSLGVPDPVNPPNATNQGGGSDLVIEDRAYIYTFVDHWGAEGPPSPASAILIGTKIDDTVRVDNFDAPPAGYNWDGGKIRVYRAVTGVSESLFLYVGEIPITTTFLLDDRDPSQLGEEIPTITWFGPPDVLQGWTLSASGSLVGFVDNTLFYSEPFLPSAWPPNYQNTVEFDIVGVAPISQSIAVITNKNPYSISGVIPNNAQPRRLDLEEPGINQKAITSIGNAAYYVSPNGVAMVTQGQASLVSASSITKEQWTNFNSVDAVSFSYMDDFCMLYDASSLSTSDIHGIENPIAPAKAVMLMDSDGGFYHYWRSASGLPVVRYHDERLFEACGDLAGWELAEINPLPIHGGIHKDFTWWSKDFEFERPMNFSVCQLEGSGFPFVVEVYADERLILNSIVENNDVFRLPGGFKAKIWSVKVRGNGRIRKISVYESVEEIANARHSAGQEAAAANS